MFSELTPSPYPTMTTRAPSALICAIVASIAPFPPLVFCSPSVKKMSVGGWPPLPTRGAGRVRGDNVEVGAERMRWRGAGGAAEQGGVCTVPFADWYLRPRDVRAARDAGASPRLGAYDSRVRQTRDKVFYFWPRAREGQVGRRLVVGPKFSCVFKNSSLERDHRYAWAVVVVGALQPNLGKKRQQELLELLKVWPP